jgi:hypothetical protein
MEELVALEPSKTHNDDRYKLIQRNSLVFSIFYIVNSSFLEAVRCKFKLTDDQLEQIFSDWLREVFLAKRRVAVGKIKSLNKNQ